jgi:hypothetical protein
MRALLAASLLVLAGCQAGPPASALVCRPVDASSAPARVFRGAPGTPVEASVPGMNSILLSPAVGERLAVHRIELGKSATGLAVVSLDLANCTARPLVVRMRTQFLDGEGRRSEPLSVWREVVVGAGSLASVDELALQRASIGFRVEIDLVDAAARP